MKLFICESQQQARIVKHRNPYDEAIVVGEPTYHLRVDEIVDLTDPNFSTPYREKWFELVQTRVNPK